MNIEFEFEGTKYVVGSQAYERDRIVLPDGRVLKVVTWLESNPPQPKVLAVLGTLTQEELAKEPPGLVAAKEVRVTRL